jgi:hypothetical protein
MSIHKLSFEIEGRSVEMIVKAGVLATMEAGKHENKVQQPQHRACVIVDSASNPPQAWIQISKSQAGSFVVINEGWIGGADGASTSFASSVRGKFLAVSPDEARNQNDAKFGILSCCTSYGNGCYVTCCNSCCSDPTACPGASCCG